MWPPFFASAFSPENSSGVRASMHTLPPFSCSSTCFLSASRAVPGFQSCPGATPAETSLVSSNFAAVHAFQPPFRMRTSGTPAYFSIHHARAASRASSAYTTVGCFGVTPSFASSSFQNAASALFARIAFDHGAASAWTAPGTCPAPYFAFGRTSSR